MPRHLLIGILIGLLASAGGCAAPGLVVRSERGLAPVGRYAEQLAVAIRRGDGQLRMNLG